MFVNFIADTHFSPYTPESRKDNYPETILNKYSQVNELYPSSYNIIAGDIFHKPTLPLKYINRVARVEHDSQKQDGHKTYVIAGNHDCIYADLDYLWDSSVGNWISTGLVSLLDVLTIDMGTYKVNIVSWPFTKSDPPKAQIEWKNDLNVLVGHAFWEPSAPPGKDFSLSSSDVEHLGYDAVVLGHDHAKYKPVTVGKTTVYRPGSLSRGTSHWSNLWREVAILRLELLPDSYIFTYEIIPSLPPEQVFSVQSRSEDKNKFKKDMSTFVKSMISSKIRSGDVYSVLDGMDMDQSLRDYVESLLLAYGFTRL